MDEKKPEPKKEPVEPKSSSTESAATSSSSAAAAPPKRSFMPNIGVQRAKKEVKEEEPKGSQRKPPQPNLNRAGRGARGGGRGGRGAENLIQSHSIFEAGPGQSVKRYGGDKEYYESTTRIGGGGGVGGGSSSSFKREANSTGPDQPQRSLRIEENLLIEDVKDEDEESSPYVCIKYEKEEPPLLGTATTTSEKLESNLDPSSSSYSVLRQIFDPLDLNEERDKLLLFQIPETLGLGDLDEGQIGKLRIRKSGKIELCINDNIVLGVSLSVAGSFLQDATVLELNDEQNSGKLTSLGHIENKIVTYQKI